MLINRYYDLLDVSNSEPFVFLEDWVGVGDDLAIVIDKAIAVVVIAWDIDVGCCDHCILRSLEGSSLYINLSTCFCLVWHS